LNTFNKIRIPSAIMASLIAAAALLASSSLKMPWEQDQPAKAAQIHALIAHGFQLSESPDFYRKNQFALYYGQFEKC
jgi:hypothetical protein